MWGANAQAGAYQKMAFSSGQFARSRRDVIIRNAFILPQMSGFEYQVGRSDAYYVICDLA